MESRQDDPVDFLLKGEIDKAIDIYLTLYIEALQSGDCNIGEDLAIQLHHCLAAKYGKLPPEALTKEVEQYVRNALNKRSDLQYDNRIIRDHISIAKESLQKAHERAKKSIEKVEKEKEIRW